MLFRVQQYWGFLQDIVEAGTGIEPVYTDLQSAASPLRQPAKNQHGWTCLCTLITQIRDAVQDRLGKVFSAPQQKRKSFTPKHLTNRWAHAYCQHLIPHLRHCPSTGYFRTRSVTCPYVQSHRPNKPFRVYQRRKRPVLHLRSHLHSNITKTDPSLVDLTFDRSCNASIQTKMPFAVRE